MRAPANPPLKLALIHDGREPGPPLGETLDFGLQDVGGQVHPGTPWGDGLLRFELELTVAGPPPAPPRFGGPFACGRPPARFLYLSWRRRVASEAPFGWRIKIPLDEITWSDIAAVQARNARLVADARPRRPHKVTPVGWHIEPAREA